MMQRTTIFLILFSAIFGTNTAFSQLSIVVDTVIQTSFCAGSPVLIPFTLPGGDYNFGNVFTAQLSSEPDLVTHFPCPLEDFDEPLDIGILPFWTGNLMFGQIPDTLTLGSYSVRIISSDPPDTSTVSSNCIIITNLPEIIFTIVGDPTDDTLCTGDSVELSVTPLPISYEWSTGETSPSIWVKQSGTYTVTARDTLGCETESDPYAVEFETCVGIKENIGELAGLAVYPVPATESIEVVFSAKKRGFVEVYVYNMLGEQVLVSNSNAIVGTNQFSLDISSLNRGVYLLKTAKDDAFVTVKMVKR